MLNRRAMSLLLGDLVALAFFAILGRNTHDEAVGFEAAQAVTGTAASFLIGWLIASLLNGIRRSQATATVVQMIRTTVTIWIVAYPLAMLVRGIALGRTSPLSFYIVAFLVPLLLLMTWRISFAVIEVKRTVRDS
jgi:hypothetical protein